MLWALIAYNAVKFTRFPAYLVPEGQKMTISELFARGFLLALLLMSVPRPRS